jgi:hypothetical protein
VLGGFYLAHLRSNTTVSNVSTIDRIYSRNTDDSNICCVAMLLHLPYEQVMGQARLTYPDYDRANPATLIRILGGGKVKASIGKIVSYPSIVSLPTKDNPRKRRYIVMDRHCGNTLVYDPLIGKGATIINTLAVQQVKSQLSSSICYSLESDV